MMGITTSRDLAGFHEERSRLYEAIATSLATAPSPLGIAALRARLAGSRSTRPAHRRTLSALDATTDEALRAEFNRLFQGTGAVSLRCQAPSGAGIAETCVADLATLAKHAHETAAAISAGQIMRAVHQTELQRNLLDDHAGTCLRSLAQTMATREDCPFYRCLGVLLQELLDEDLAVLASPVNP